MNLPDPRSEGSGNPGATNVLRLGNKVGAGLTLSGDILKGVLPVLAARWLSDDSSVGRAGRDAGAFFGHLFPLFFGFKGGKGVATALGVFATISLPVAGGLALTWLVVALVFRYSSTGGAHERRQCTAMDLVATGYPGIHRPRDASRTDADTAPSGEHRTTS